MNVYGLLDIKDTSPALSHYKSSISQSETIYDRSQSPAHKRPRLDSNAARPTPGARPTVSIRISVTFPDQPRTSSLNSQDLLSTVKAFVSQILQEKPISSTYGSIYNACRDLVIQANVGQTLHDLLKQALHSRASEIACRLTSRSEEDPIQWIKLFVEQCELFLNHIDRLSEPLVHLDQVYAKDNKLSSIREIAFSQFHSEVLHNSSSMISDRLFLGVSKWIDYEREKKEPHHARKTFDELIRHLTLHGFFDRLEAHLLSHSRQYFQKEGERLYAKIRESGGAIGIDANESDAAVMIIDARGLLDNIRARVQEEVNRTKEMSSLPPSTSEALKTLVEQTLIIGDSQDKDEGIADWVARSTLADLLSLADERRKIEAGESHLKRTVVSELEKKQSIIYKQLQEQYELFKRVQLDSVLPKAFKTSVQMKVQAIVNDTANDDRMANALQNLKSLLEDVIGKCFTFEKSLPSVGSSSSASRHDSTGATSSAKYRTKKAVDPVFSSALHAAFYLAFKTRPLVPAEQIARTIDREMRRGQRKATEKEYTARLKTFLSLCRYTDDKDVFRKFYHRSLAKRLLLERSASDDEEKKMLKLLAKDYDPEFGECEGMFKDLALSRDMTVDFHAHNARNDSLYSKLSAMVLQQSAWPFASAQDQTVLLPQEMADALHSYEAFYKSKHKDRKLYWNYALGTVTLKGRFTLAEKELSVSLYQALVLLLFNEGDKFDFEEIQERVSLGDDELVRTLQSLALGKKRVLKKLRGGKEVAKDDIFAFNDGFTDDRAKVHINSIQAKVSPEERRRTQNVIEGDRKYLLDAAIVRIMKGKKELSLENLLTATIDAVKAHFRPEVLAIKTRVESLVEQEYLERKEGTKNIFLYVA